MTRTMTVERLWNPVGGNPNGGSGSIDWMTQNYCRECRHITFKGTILCPRCHGRVRITPRKSILGVDKRVYKKAQDDAALYLKEMGWKLPPPSIGARSMFKFRMKYEP